MPALTISTTARSSMQARSWADHTAPERGRPSGERSASPAANGLPRHSDRTTSTTPPRGFMPWHGRAEPAPVSPSHNSDAIALRSAMAILRIQREQSQRDMQALERLKRRAVADPDRFRRELAAGRIHSGPGSKRLFGAQLGDVGNRSSRREGGRSDNEDGDEGDEGDEGDDDEGDEGDEGDDGDDGDDGTSDASAMDVDSHEDQDEHASVADTSSPCAFEPIPTPQKVVRCPPINWAKYHVVGPALDQLHEAQRTRPTPGEPRRDDERSYLGEREPETVIAAPYRPFVDRIAEPMQTRSGSRKAGPP
ncbi:MAG: hypothetical protein M1832_001330 [Thelocarpon impressellum]|nr:MAG: hypothetical protein M1832_001330 [Thelocarpon impressellum]